MLCDAILTLDKVEDYLTRPRSLPPETANLCHEELAKLKAKAVELRDEAQSKDLWKLEKIIGAQVAYIRAFLLLKDRDYYAAWCEFEVCENTLKALLSHLDDEGERYGLPFIKRMVTQWQSLFPYGLFSSPEILVKKQNCSICGEEISLRKRCDHKVGEIYRGMRCHLIIEEAEFLGLSLVHNPVQKYSVLFANDKDGKQIDQYDYSIVKFVSERLEDPFDDWSHLKTTTLHPHSVYSHIGRNEKCPCGSSQKYKKCCLSKREGIEMPHLEIEFEVQPDASYANIIYPSKPKDTNFEERTFSVMSMRSG